MRRVDFDRDILGFIGDIIGLMWSEVISAVQVYLGNESEEKHHREKSIPASPYRGNAIFSGKFNFST